MLLVADRLADGERLQRVLAAVEPCALVALDGPALAPAAAALVVCDVALDRPAAVQALVARHRASASTPVLYLDRSGGGEAALARARAIGATAVLPRGAPDAQLLFTVRRLAEASQAPSRPRARPNPAGAAQAGVALDHMFSSARSGKPVGTDDLARGAVAVMALVDGERIGTWLDVVRAVDDAVYQHCILVAGLAVCFAARLGVTLRGRRLIAEAALVHDLGKAGVPAEILNKPGSLTGPEMALMRTHAAVGHAMLAGQGGFDPQILDIVRHHHEYIDGTGYPDGLSGARVSAPVRLVTICDVYAALIERRAYKEPTTPGEALDILDAMGPKLDQGLLRAFAAMVREG